MNIDNMSNEKLKAKLLEGVDLLTTSQECFLAIREASNDLSKSPEGRLNAVNDMLDEMAVPQA